STIMSYGEEDRTRGELELALSELADEHRPPTVARLQLPDGVRIERVEIEVARSGVPDRLARPVKATRAGVVGPEPRSDTGKRTAELAGAWVFIPVLDHACYVDRKEKLEERVAAEVAVLPAALALDLDGWKRLLTWAEPSLEPLEIELA